jgi:putative transposase
VVKVRYDPSKHHRRSIRLKNYDYSQAGAYFVTICTRNRVHLFGEVVDGEMRLNDAGRMVAEVWKSLPERFATVMLDAFVVMPNHFHGIIVIVDTVGAPLVGAQDRGRHGDAPTGATTRVAPTLGDVIGAFKSVTTVEYVRGVRERGWRAFPKRLWQRNYYEHIIRNERELDAIRRYIFDNPQHWYADQYNADRIGSAPAGVEIE